MMTFLVVEADILLLEPLNDQEFDGAVRRKMLTSKMFLKFAQCGEVCRDNSGLYDGCGSYSLHQMPNRSNMAQSICGLVLSCTNNTLWIITPSLQCQISSRHFNFTWQTTVVTEAPHGKKNQWEWTQECPERFFFVVNSIQFVLDSPRRKAL